MGGREGGVRESVEPYKERTCYTQNKESCVTKPFRNCTGVIETNVERVCFDVNELVCDLVEAVHYETLEETYQVQRCFTGKDRVCDTTYKIDMTTKDDYQCTNVETPNCYMEEKVINDVTCKNSVEFNCKRDKSTKNDGYGPKGVVCDRKPTQSCYNIPRKIQVEVCKTDVHRYCEKFSNIFPFPVEEQNCHFEPKKICELEMKTRPKKAKKYSTPRTARSSPGRSVINARRNPSSPCVTPRRGWSAPTTLRRLAMTWTSSTATRSRRLCWRKYAI